MALHHQLPIYKTGCDLVSLAVSVQQQMPMAQKHTATYREQRNKPCRNASRRRTAGSRKQLFRFDGTSKSQPSRPRTARTCTDAARAHGQGRFFQDLQKAQIMSETTGINWCDSTFNPWIGCTKVGPGCDNCYAKADFEDRRHRAVWGPGQQRQRTSVSNWNLPIRWERNHAEFFATHGHRQRVFCSSLADVFDNEVDPQWRIELFRLIAETKNLDWLILTKRIGNARAMLDRCMSAYTHGREGWRDNYLPNVWLGATIVNQEEADRDIPKLLAVPAAKRFLSMEPLLGPVSLDAALWSYDGPKHSRRGLLDWVIVGGESGPNARPMHPDWALSLRDQCVAAGVPFLFKQWGEWKPICQMEESEHTELYKSRIKAGPNEDQSHIDDIYGKTCTVPYSVLHLDGSGHDVTEPNAFIVGAMQTFKIGKKSSGRLLDGRTWEEVPA